MLFMLKMIAEQVDLHAESLSMKGSWDVDFFQKSILGILDGPIKEIIPEFVFNLKLEDKCWVKTFMRL
jgi:hypothetical protein